MRRQISHRRQQTRRTAWIVAASVIGLFAVGLGIKYLASGKPAPKPSSARAERSRVKKPAPRVARQKNPKPNTRSPVEAPAPRKTPIKRPSPPVPAPFGSPEMEMEPEMEAPPAPSAIGFESSVLPILKNHCFKCHGPDKKKGGLRLDGRGWIARGGDEGKVIVPGNPAKSPLYARTILPDDDDRMPSKGSALGKPVTDVLRRWIVRGADFGGWRGTPGGSVAVAAPVAPPPPSAPADPSGGSERIQVLRALGEGVSSAPSSAIKAARRAGARVEPAVPGGTLLRVDYVSREGDIGDAEIAALTPLADRIAQLDLAKTGITNRALATVGRFKRLTRLNLSRTAITDAGLRKLSGLGELRYLNLFATGITDAGLASLGGLEKLEALYLSQTKVTEAGVSRLRGRLSGAKIVSQFIAPVRRRSGND